MKNDIIVPFCERIWKNDQVSTLVINTLAVFAQSIKTATQVAALTMTQLHLLGCAVL